MQICGNDFSRIVNITIYKCTGLASGLLGDPSVYVKSEEWDTRPASIPRFASLPLAIATKYECACSMLFAMQLSLRCHAKAG